MIKLLIFLGGIALGIATHAWWIDSEAKRLVDRARDTFTP